MAYWALFYKHRMEVGVSTNPKGDAFAVCELDKLTGLGPGSVMNADYTFDDRPPNDFQYFIRDENTGHEIMAYDYKEIEKHEFDNFIAFECGPEAKSICGDDDEYPRLYILK